MLDRHPTNSRETVDQPAGTGKIRDWRPMMERLLFWRARNAEAKAMRSAVDGLRGDIGVLTARLAEIQQAMSIMARAAEASGTATASLHAEAKLQLEKLAVASGTATASLHAEAKLQLEKLAVELPNRLTHLDTSLHSRLNNFENEYFVDFRNRLQHLWNSAEQAAEGRLIASEAKALLEKLAVEIPNALIHLGTSLGSRLNVIESTAIASEAKALLEKLAVEIPNALIHLSTSFGSRLNLIENALSHVDTTINSTINSRLIGFENMEFPDLNEQIHEIAAINLRANTPQDDHGMWKSNPAERYAPAKPQSFNSYLKLAKQDFPHVYRAWRQRLDTTQQAFDETKVGNAAHASDLYSRLFRDFVAIHAKGRVLDVGCGVYGRPYYLGSYPAELLSGIEPLPMKQAADFELVRGISEYLPWPDSSFSTVISATSLDHCLSLRKSLAEMRRVLCDEGKILLWIGSVPGSPKFAPDNSDFEPADKFHLFHFDVAWLDPMLEEQFEIIDRLKFKRPAYSHVFYSLQPMQNEAAAAET